MKRFFKFIFEVMEEAGRLRAQRYMNVYNRWE